MNDIPIVDSLNFANLAIVLLTLFAGLAITYFGFWLHKAAIYLIGAFWGALVMTLIGAAVSGDLAWLWGIGGFFLGGGLALAIHHFIVFAIGFSIGLFAALAMQLTEPLAMVITGLVFGTLMLVAYKFMVVVFTSFSGAVLLLVSIINMGNLSETSNRLIMLPSFFSYFGRLAKTFWHSSEMGMVVNTASNDLAVYLILVVSGIAGQYILLHRGFSLFSSDKAQASRQSPNHTNQTKSDVNQDIPSNNRQSEPDYGLSLYIAQQWVKTLPLSDDGPVSVGRDEANSIVLQDQDLSRHHCHIERCEDQLIFRDLNSTNGTWYLGREKKVQGTLEPDEWIVVGNAQLMFHRL
ncbi:FHA domain-containing protein [Alteromonas hispanica]|uniref:FHA domain-containing protein n=1 Tax=Alteromonas hispanica TaxID=315421 RepID=A0A6L9MTB4_9ALTE|nr:FHA domain-containing protein [Alteromonas hispanica]NDW21193.1 FHA domain-containing protein [Alteromonas hispanica]